MAGTIWVYVKGEQKPTVENALVYAESGHSCSGTKSALVYKKEHVLPESHEQMLSIARKVAEEKGMRLQICDVSSRTGSLRTRLARVSKTPTVIFRNRRIVENITDAVLSSLDAGNPRLYRRINRPWPALSYELLLEGLVAFRRRYRGKLWIEVMLIKGINDGEKELQEIAEALRRIGPDQVHISLPSRPPAETSVQLPDEDRLNRAAAILGCRAQIIQAAIGTFDLSGYENAAAAVLAIIRRHPMQEEQLRRTLERWSPGQVEEALRQLHSSGEAQIVERYGERYWSAAACRYPSCDAHSPG